MTSSTGPGLSAALAWLGDLPQSAGLGAEGLKGQESEPPPPPPREELPDAALPQASQRLAEAAEDATAREDNNDNNNHNNNNNNSNNNSNNNNYTNNNRSNNNNNNNNDDSNNNNPNHDSNSSNNHSNNHNNNNNPFQPLPTPSNSFQPNNQNSNNNNHNNHNNHNNNHNNNNSNSSSGSWPEQQWQGRWHSNGWDRKEWQEDSWKQGGWQDRGWQSSSSSSSRSPFQPRARSTGAPRRGWPPAESWSSSTRWSAAESAAESSGSDFNTAVTVDVKGNFEIHLERRRLGDAELSNFCDWLPRKLELLKQEGLLQQVPGFFIATVVDLSFNRIGDDGVRRLMTTLRELKVVVGKLFLFRNMLGRGAANVLASWIRSDLMPPFELHLSHNFVPSEGVLELLEAVASTGKYPSQRIRRSSREEPRCPLWLRIESNLPRAEDFCVEAEKILRICWVTDRSDKRGCRSDWCAHKTGADLTPVHLTYATQQRRNEGVVPDAAKRWDLSRSPEEERLRWSVPPAHLPTPEVHPIPPVSEEPSVAETRWVLQASSPLFAGLSSGGTSTAEPIEAVEAEEEGAPSIQSIDEQQGEHTAEEAGEKCLELDPEMQQELEAHVEEVVVTRQGLTSWLGEETLEIKLEEQILEEQREQKNEEHVGQELLEQQLEKEEPPQQQLQMGEMFQASVLQSPAPFEWPRLSTSREVEV